MNDPVVFRPEYRSLKLRLGIAVAVVAALAIAAFSGGDGFLAAFVFAILLLIPATASAWILLYPKCVVDPSSVTIRNQTATHVVRLADVNALVMGSGKTAGAAYLTTRTGERFRIWAIARPGRDGPQEMLAELQAAINVHR